MSSTKTTLSHFFSDCNNFQEGWISLTSSSVMIFYGSSFVSLVFQSGSEQFSMHHSMKNTAVTMMMRQQQHNSNNNEFVIQVIRVCSIFSKKKKKIRGKQKYLQNSLKYVHINTSKSCTYISSYKKVTNASFNQRLEIK